MKYIASVLSLFMLSLIALSQQAPPDCHPEKSHQFDFWIGNWEVTSNGQVVGRNRIEPILKGCVLQENWTGSKGSMGSSINFYNPKENQWEQFWVWRHGVPMHFKGDFQDGKMVLKSEIEGQQGKEIHRITWTPNQDGTVRQKWEKRSKDQDTWQPLFDGLYRKIESN